MKKIFLYAAVLVAFIGFSASSLVATPEIMQLHLKEMGDVEGGCAYCHNNSTKIHQREHSKQGYMKRQRNYHKFSNMSKCNECHTKQGIRKK